MRKMMQLPEERWQENPASLLRSELIMLQYASYLFTSTRHPPRAHEQLLSLFYSGSKIFQLRSLIYCHQTPSIKQPLHMASSTTDTSLSVYADDRSFCYHWDFTQFRPTVCVLPSILRILDASLNIGSTLCIKDTDGITGVYTQVLGNVIVLILNC